LKDSKDEDWEQELTAELHEYEVVGKGGHKKFD